MSIEQLGIQSHEERPVGLRARRDLIVQESTYQKEYCWIIKDPLAMKYFRLGKPEYLVLQKLADPISYHELKLELTQAFPDFNVRLESVQQLVTSLHRSGLLVSGASGQAVPLEKRRNKELLRKFTAILPSLMSPKFPGWDPERFLTWIYPKSRFFFSTWFTAGIAALCIAAITLLLTNFHDFIGRLPEFQQFFAFDNLLFMAGILIFTKSIHELGHGLMCKHFGGECHQIGLMLLVMTPAMYCDTSDSWILRNRWHRMAIGAAGMYVELCLAAVCTFVWWYTNPGWIHFLALNIMFLCSVSTLLFNANPLLKYDGYYILSDFLEIPNLAHKSQQALISKLRVLCLGMGSLPPRRTQPNNSNLLAAYSLTSLFYRWFITIAILWFISKTLEPYGLSAVAHVLIVLSIVTMVVVPLTRLIRFFLYPGRVREVKMRRFSISIGLAAAFLLFIAYVPFPHYVWAVFVVRPMNAQMVIVPQAGRLDQVFFRAGDWVEEGATIAVLANSELKIEIDDLKGRLARLNAERIGYELTSAVQLEAARKIAETTAQMASLQQQIELKEQQLQQLTIRASRSGMFFAPPNIPDRPLGLTDFPTWAHTPLDSRNAGTYLEANTLLGSIGEPQEMEANLIVDQSDIEFVHLGQKVIALPQQASSRFIMAEISGVANNELVVVPRELSQTNQGPIAVKPHEAGGETPLLKSYEAFAIFQPESLAQDDLQLLPGMSGHAKIHVGSSSLGSRLKRYLLTVIHFR